MNFRIHIVDGDGKDRTVLHFPRHSFALKCKKCDKVYPITTFADAVTAADEANAHAEECKGKKP